MSSLFVFVSVIQALVRSGGLPCHEVRMKQLGACMYKAGILGWPGRVCYPSIHPPCIAGPASQTLPHSPSPPPQKNHLSGLQRKLLKLSFWNMEGLQQVCEAGERVTRFALLQLGWQGPPLPLRQLGRCRFTCSHGCCPTHTPPHPPTHPCPACPRARCGARWGLSYRATSTARRAPPPTACSARRRAPPRRRPARSGCRWAGAAGPGCWGWAGTGCVCRHGGVGCWVGIFYATSS